MTAITSLIGGAAARNWKIATLETPHDRYKTSEDH